MKIVFFIYSLSGGGAERVTAHLAGELARQGHDILLLTMQPAVNDHYPVPDTVERRVIPVPQPNGAGIATRLWRVIVRAVRFRRELRDSAPDCVVSMMTRENNFAIVSSMGTGVPCIVAERNDPASREYGAVQMALRQRLYRYADAVVVQTDAGKRWLDEQIRTRAVFTIPNPIVYPLPRDKPVIDSALPHGKHRVLVVGRLAPQKQIDHALRAYHALGACRRDWTLTIIGDGPQRDALHALANTLQLGECVEFLPRVGNMGDWYRSSDLLVMPSAYEGFPNVLVEAMSHGLPVISYDCRTGPAEIVHDGVDGLLVPTNDIDSLSHAMKRLVSDTAARQSYAAAARQIRSRYALPDVAGQWLHALQQAIND